MIRFGTVFLALLAPPATAQTYACHLTAMAGPNGVDELDLTVPMEISPMGTVRFGPPGETYTLREVREGPDWPRIFVGEDDYGTAVLALRSDGIISMAMMAEHTAAPWHVGSGQCEESR